MARNSHSVIRLAMRRWLVAVLILAAPLAAVIITFYRQDLHHERRLVQVRARDVLNLAAEKISRELRSVKSDILYLSRQNALRRFLADPETSRELEREYVAFAQERSSYDQIRLLNLDGDEVIRVNDQDGIAVAVPQAELQPKSSRYYFREATALELGQVFVSPMDLNVEHGEIQTPHKPVIRFVTPVVDADGARSGYLVLNYLGRHLINEFTEATRGLAGKSYIVNSAGDFLYSPDPDEAWGWQLGHQKTLHSEYAELPPRILESGSDWTSDQGLFLTARFAAVFDGTGASQSARESTDGESVDTSLILVCDLPWDVIDARSDLLLQRLLATAAGALILLGVGAGYWAHASAMRVHQRQRLAESEARLRVLSKELLNAQEDERRRISRDLHDDLSQQITAISLDLQSAAGQKSPDKAHQLLSKTIEASSNLLAAVHRIAGDLRPSVLDDLEFSTAVESLVEELERLHGIDVHCDLRMGDVALAHDIKENAYRIIQEGLSNAARHSQAREVNLRLEAADGCLQLRIADEGAGFDADETNAARLGLLGMRERAELLGGTFELETSPGKGTTINVRLPLARQNGSST